MSSPTTPDVKDLPVRFVPPLALERQRWILETLRLNRALSVLDIGCGEGSLLNALCNPATSVPNEPPDKYLTTPIRDLSLTRVAALDIDPSVIQDAAHAATFDREPHYLAPWGSGEDGWYVRWAPLEVAVWLGRLEVANSSFYGFDAIVSTEVIEHVPDDVLPAFSHVLLGQYRPRLLLLTTPNYTFNARFHPPGVPRKGFPDPTGQTSRVFRHSDHKREWTVPEFDAWCREAADTHGYDMTLGGVGLPTEPDPFNRQLGYASQTALFVRRDSCAKSANPLSLFGGSAGPQHQLIAQRTFEADPRAGCAQPARVIRDALVYLMRMRGEGQLTVSELWSELAMPCGGSVVALVDALMEQPNTSCDNEHAHAQIRDDHAVEAGGEDTIGQWSILPPRNPNSSTDPRWDRVVVWEAFRLEPLPNGEDQGVAELEDDREFEYGDEYGFAEDDQWKSADSEAVASATHNPTPWGRTEGWGQDQDEGTSGWGDVNADDAAAAAVWGVDEPNEKVTKH